MNATNAGRPLDVLFVNADSSLQAYQALSETYSAIEPPTWALLLAQSCRGKGFGAAILDCGAETLAVAEAVQRVSELQPQARRLRGLRAEPELRHDQHDRRDALAAQLKETRPSTVICFVGSHTSALPREVLSLPYVDIVLLNEGVYALHNLLAAI